ncbi:hypothetical protein NDU88_002810 [Pleurodeles waltl]|uniref:Uncharacterized protein n=1 Tax=Pleurodeles waltl TaxID=8319 RepID=A0AAV7W2X5_PLEWA|nr:hypothetical protein NDU88_002810 [Pleurodeles waltl]
MAGLVRFSGQGFSIRGRARRAAHLQRLSGGGGRQGSPAQSRASRPRPQPPIWSVPWRRGGRREGGVGGEGPPPPPRRCGSRFAVGRGSLPAARLPALSPRLRSRPAVSGCSRASLPGGSERSLSRTPPFWAQPAPVLWRAKVEPKRSTARQGERRFHVGEAAGSQGVSLRLRWSWMACRLEADDRGVRSTTKVRPQS